jgi:hypothetical protein
MLAPKNGGGPQEYRRHLYKAGNPMKTRFSFIGQVSVLFFLIVGGPLDAYGAGQIDVILDRGVSREAEAQTRLAIDATVDFFKKTYGLTLNNKLEIFVVPDKQAHIKELKQRYSLTESEALIRAENTGGSARDGTIIVNVHNAGSAHLIFCICHEIVHYFQGQVSRNFCSIMWMTEGVANALAAQIVAAAGVKCPESSQWLEVLKKAPKTPRLEHLHSFRDWDTAIKTDGQTVAYAISSVAVMTLIQSKGTKPLFTFFHALRNAKPEDAFSQAFGVRLSDFEKDFRPF